MLVAEGAQRLHVRHRDRLAARHVDGARERDVRDLLRSVLGDERVELVEVDVALERMPALGIVCLVADDVDEDAPGTLLVEPRRREVHVPGNELSGPDRDLADQVLGAAPLVRRHDMRVAVVAPDRRFEAVEVAAPGVRLVAEHHAGPLAVAHRVRAGVGEEIDVDVVGAQQEGVVAGLGQSALALLARRHPQRLDHLDLPRLRPRAAAELLAGGDGRVLVHPARFSLCTASRAAEKQSTAKSRSAVACAAEICVRMRAAPRGTTGYEKLTA